MSIKRVRELRIKIKNEACNFDLQSLPVRIADGPGGNKSNPKKQKKIMLTQKPNRMTLSLLIF